MTKRTNSVGREAKPAREKTKAAGEGEHGTKVGACIRAFLITAVAACVLFYLSLPALNPHSEEFWENVIFLMVIFAVSFAICDKTGPKIKPAIEMYTSDGKLNVRKLARRKKGKNRAYAKLFMTPPFLVLLLFLAGFLSGSKFLHARAYSRILTVKEGDVTRIPSSDGTDTIALMDTASAEKLGDRKIGSLTSVVSQYDVGEYTQIDYRKKPVKTAPLEYAGFFKWMKNKDRGIPGYVVVDPVSMSADYVKMSKGMRYVPSAFFNENLERHLRFSYPTKMFTNIHFEINENGEGRYVAPTCGKKIGLFGGTQITGAVICDPVSGKTVWYPVGKIPRWADVIYSGDLICSQYNDYAQLHDGYWNSVIGQTGCRKITESGDRSGYMPDFGYVAKDGDIWIYTGITSLNNDSSNIGFIMANERTEETIFVECPGADEFSAMTAAQGEVQEKRYAASFPSLILVDGKPTYIMVMKDAGGLVKMYAAVNVEQYNMVATAAKQKDCIDKYRALLGGEITQEEAGGEGELTETAKETESGKVREETPDLSKAEVRIVTVEKMQTIDRDGDTWLYLVDSEKRIYAAKYEDVLDMLLVEVGDVIRIRTDGTYFVPDKEKI